MEHNLDISGEMQAIDALYKTQQQFKALENTMLDAIAKKPKTQPKRPNMPGLPTNEEIRNIINLSNLAYNNGEIFSSKLLTDALDKGIYWFPVIKARLALALSNWSQKQLPFTIAKESITDNPEETDAYFAIAVILRLADSPFQAQSWLNIAKKGKPTMTRAMKDFESDLKSDLEDFIQREPSILAIISSPKQLERYQDQATIKPWFDSQATKLGITRVRADPTSETLRTECAKNVPFRRFVQRLSIVGVSLGLYSFTTFGGDELVSALKQTAGSFYNWDQSLITRLSYYLDLTSIAKMQASCLPLRQMFDDATVWSGVYEKLTMRPFSPSYDLARVVTDGLGMGSPKTFVKSWIYCVQFYQICERDKTLTDVENPNMNLVESLTRLEILYGYNGLGHPSVFVQWLSRMIDIVSMDLRHREKWQHVAPVVLVLSRIPHTKCFEHALDYFSMVLAGHSLVGLPHEDLTPSSKTRLCSTMASLQMPPSYDWQCVTPSDASILHLGQTVAFDFNGYYHLHMSYTDPKYFRVREIGVAYLAYTATGLRGCCSMASSAGFDIELRSDTLIDDVRNQIVLSLRCPDGTSIYLRGQIQPSGIGGYFGPFDPNVELSQLPILGYWHMRKAKTGSKEFTEEEALAMVPKQEHPFLYPLRSPPSNISTLHAKLRLTKATMQLLGSPFTTVQSIVDAQKRATDPEFKTSGDTKPISPLKSPYETTAKYELRKEVSSLYAHAVYQQLANLLKSIAVQVKVAIPVLRDVYHPEFEATFDWWTHCLCFSGQNLEHEIQAVCSLLQIIEADEDDEDDEDDDGIDGDIDGKENGTRLSTVVAVVAIGVAVLSSVALARSFLSMKRKTSQ